MSILTLFPVLESMMMRYGHGASGKFLCITVIPLPNLVPMLNKSWLNGLAPTGIGGSSVSFMVVRLFGVYLIIPVAIKIATTTTTNTTGTTISTVALIVSLIIILEFDRIRGEGENPVTTIAKRLPQKYWGLPTCTNTIFLTGISHPFVIISAPDLHHTEVFAEIILGHDPICEITPRLIFWVVFSVYFDRKQPVFPIGTNEQKDFHVAPCYKCTLRHPLAK